MNVGYLFRRVFRLAMVSRFDSIRLFFLDFNLLILDSATGRDLEDNIFNARN